MARTCHDTFLDDRIGHVAMPDVKSIHPDTIVEVPSVIIQLCNYAHGAAWTPREHRELFDIGSAPDVKLAAIRKFSGTGTLQLQNRLQGAPYHQFLAVPQCLSVLTLLVL